MGSYYHELSGREEIVVNHLLYFIDLVFIFRDLARISSTLCACTDIPILAFEDNTSRRRKCILTREKFSYMQLTMKRLEKRHFSHIYENMLDMF